MEWNLLKMISYLYLELFDKVLDFIKNSEMLIFLQNLNGFRSSCV